MTDPAPAPTPEPPPGPEPSDVPVGTAVIIGAGPAGLTAAYELVTRTPIRPIVLEAAPRVGGLSCTVVHGDNRIDIGGHRFFSKSDRVMRWWLDRLPLQRLDDRQRAAARLVYQGRERALGDLTSGPADAPDPERDDRVMLLRRRKSRIYHRGRFFDYPLSLSARTLRRLGAWRTLVVGLSYVRARMMPIRPEETLEDFVINRFGRALYRTFFRDYTEKVWGRPCSEISAEWGRQRIKGLSIARAVATAARRALGLGGPVETSLIEQFLYPKYGPGQMWETTRDEVLARGGEVITGARVDGVGVRDGRAHAVTATMADGSRRRWDADHVFSTMPVRELVTALDTASGPTSPLDDDARAVAAGLCYRDFLTVGLLVPELVSRDGDLDDCWIYIQEPDVRVGRLQLFDNWSPWMVGGDGAWVGLEYFLDTDDPLWTGPDADAIALAADELHRLGLLADPASVRDGCVIRMPKAYPAYFGSYPRFDVLREQLDAIDNLWLIGRNGMHRYNNQDHSMLAAMTAVDTIARGSSDKASVWAVNTEPDYHEEA